MATLEAWRGASAGWGVERRKAATGVPTPLDFDGRPHGGGRECKPSSDPASSENSRTSRHVLHENRETAEMSERQQGTDREAKAQGRTAFMYVSEESDHAVVPLNLTNKAINRRRRGERQTR
jgi:hypothetical protein